MRATTSAIASYCLALLAWGVAVPSAPSVQDVSERTDAIFAPWAGPDSPGCAVAVMHAGEIEYAQGYGMADLEHGVPITPETVFYIGSTSKQFVAACVALLQEDGTLDLDDEVRAHIPEFPQYQEPVTIRQLIHHTSGVRDYLELWHLAGRDYLDYMAEQAVLEMICRQRELNFTPGSRRLYSNSCYFLLGVLVERASGVSLREYAQERVFGHLGMASTRFHDDHEELIPNRAFSYRRRADGGYANLIMRFDLVGSGGVYSTVEDLALWDRNFYDNRLGQGGPGLLETLHTRGVLDDGTSLEYAFALIHGTYRGAKTVSHGGALAGYRAELLRFPEHDFSVAVLCNLGSMNPTDLAEQVADVWLGDDLPQPAPSRAPASPTAREVASVDSSVLESYTGTYELSEGTVTITAEEGRLTMETSAGETIHAWPESETRFFVREVPMLVRFEPEQDGTCNKIVVTWQGRDLRGERVAPPAVDHEELRGLAGDYFSEELEVTYRLSVVGDALQVSVGYATPFALERRSADEWEGRQATFVFERDDDGEVAGFLVSTGRVKNVTFGRN